MATLSNKHQNAEQLYYGDFSGGLNLALPPDALEVNEMQKAVNFEYDLSTGAPRLRAGLVLMATMQEKVRNILTVAGQSSILIRTISNKMYRLTDYSLSGVIGTLEGDGEISYAPWGESDELIMCAGGKLFFYNGETVDIVTESLPVNDQVYVKAGRVGCIHKGSDEITYSGVGDAHNWKLESSLGDTWTDADAVSLQVGYKDGCDMTCVAPLTTDLMVFKSPAGQPGMGRIYRVTGNYPDWVVLDHSSDSSACTHGSTATTNNDLLFITKEGIASLRTVTDYGDIKMQWAGAKVNPRIAKEMDVNNCMMWKMPSASQIWVRTKPTSRVWVLSYGIEKGAWTTFEFPEMLADACSVGSDRYVAIGTQIFRMDDMFGTDNGQPFTGIIKMQGIRKMGQILAKRSYIAYSSDAASIAKLNIENNMINLPLGGQVHDIAMLDTDFVFNDDDQLMTTTSASVRTRMNIRTWDATVEVYITRGPFKLNALGLEIAEV